jgi:hypothetical protein
MDHDSVPETEPVEVASKSTTGSFLDTFPMQMKHEGHAEEL